MPSLQAFAFGPFRLDPAARRLTRDGAELVLGARAFDTLSALAAAAGETVTKEALLDQVWSGVVVEENNLQVQISALRKLLGESWIATVPGRGYRLAMAPPTQPAPPLPPDAPPLPDRPSIAVLPFANPGGDPDQEFFSDGVAEEILTELSRDRRLFVIGRASSFMYRGGAVDLRQVGRELGVRYVLDGSVRRAGQHLRVTARLNDAATAATIWTDRYDRDLADIFALQDEIAAAVTQAAGLAVAEAEQKRVQRRPPADLTAWEAYQRGLWHLLRLTAEETDAAIRHFRRATELDSAFASAWIGWAQATLTLHGRFGKSSFSEGGNAVLALAQRAVDCDGTDPDAHVTKSAALILLGEMPDAWLSAREAERLEPASPRVIQMLGLLQIFSGNRAEGRRLLEQAMRRDPRSWIHVYSRVNHNWSLFLDGEYEATLAVARQAINRSPRGEIWAYRHAAAALAELGRLDEAHEALRVALSVGPDELAAYMRARIPWQRPEDSRRLQNALRKAGWRD